MDRREAVLRELNLYPLWVRRKQAAPIQADAPAQVTTAPELMAASAIATSVAPAAPGAIPVAAANIEAAPDQSREQNISELDWPQLKATVRDCTACKLRAGCTQTVFGVGDEHADWLFVGEGPGADEDAQGEPFVGQAGKLLDNMLLAIKLRRGKKVYIANIVKCRPPNNRTPEEDEIATCMPYLKRQIELINPRVIVALGKTASTALLGNDAPLGSLRGKVHDFNGIPLVVTYHPAYLLRTPSEKAKAWHDLCFATEFMQRL
jgi:DNA polymerase